MPSSGSGLHPVMAVPVKIGSIIQANEFYVVRQSTSSEWEKLKKFSHLVESSPQRFDDLEELRFVAHVQITNLRFRYILGT